MRRNPREQPIRTQRLSRRDYSIPRKSLSQVNNPKFPYLNQEWKIYFCVTIDLRLVYPSPKGIPYHPQQQKERPRYDIAAVDSGLTSKQTTNNRLSTERSLFAADRKEMNRELGGASHTFNSRTEGKDLPAKLAEVAGPASFSVVVTNAPQQAYRTAMASVSIKGTNYRNRSSNAPFPICIGELCFNFVEYSLSFI
jgi:hypothetical protein